MKALLFSISMVVAAVAQPGLNNQWMAPGAPENALTPADTSIVGCVNGGYTGSGPCVRQRNTTLTGNTSADTVTADVGIFANIIAQDTTPGIRDTVLSVAASGDIDSLLVDGGAQFTENIVVNRVSMGMMPNSDSGVLSEASLVFGRNAGELGVYAPLNILIGENAGRGDTTDPVTYPNNINDVVIIGTWGLTKGRNAIDLAGLGNFVFEDCRDCQGSDAVGWRSQRGAVNSSENSTSGANSLGKNRNGSQNVVKGVNGVAECDSCSSLDASGFRTGQYWQNSHFAVTKGAWSGFYYGGNADTLTKTDNGLFLGAFSQPKFDSSVNEIALGYGAVGFGSYTATIGNSEITAFVPGASGMELGDPARRWGNAYLDGSYYRSAIVLWDSTNGLILRGNDSGVVNSLTIQAAGGAYAFEIPTGTNNVHLNRETGNTFIGQKLSIGTGSVASGFNLLVVGGSSAFAASTTSYSSIVIPPGVAPTVPAHGAMWTEGGNLYYFDGTDTYTIDKTVVP